MYSIGIGTNLQNSRENDREDEGGKGQGERRGQAGGPSEGDDNVGEENEDNGAVDEREMDYPMPDVGFSGWVLGFRRWLQLLFAKDVAEQKHLRVAATILQHAGMRCRLVVSPGYPINTSKWLG